MFSLKRLGFLEPGFARSLVWSSARTGEETGRIGVKYEEHGLTLDYRARDYGGEWEPIKDFIPLSQTYPNYGGVRYWMICPSCNTRRGKLYGGKYFRCRGCYDACYDSQLECQLGRTMARMHKRRQALGDYNGLDGPFPEKPKWMRWRTYDALVEADYQDDARMGMEFMRRFGGVI